MLSNVRMHIFILKTSWDACLADNITGVLAKERNYPSIDQYHIQGYSSPVICLHCFFHYRCSSHILSFAHPLCAVSMKEM